MTSARRVEEVDDGWVADHLPDRPPRAHKGTFGRLLIVAGSFEYGGAPLLTGLGAARMGAGLVTVAVPESLQRRLVGAVPELTWLALSEDAGGLASAGGWRRLAGELARYDAMVVGPGLGRHPVTSRRVRRLLAERSVPAVIDADALNALAEEDRWWRTLRAPAVLTPHPLEFSRLLGSPNRAVDDSDYERANAAADAARDWDQVVVLKGACTVIAAPDARLVRSRVETPALATAGTGDVLAGAIGALIAAGLEPFTAAVCGVAIHATAGLVCEERIGAAGTMASDVAGALPEAMGIIRSARPPAAGGPPGGGAQWS